MKLTCEQMDVLISFYIDNELNKNIKNAVEEHLKTCFHCKTKYEIIKSLSESLSKKIATFNELKYEQSDKIKTNMNTPQYKLFKQNLSAYIDNELPEKESIKIKKIVINNPTARMDLENSYKLKHLINTSAQKTKNYIKHDFSKKIMSQLKPIQEKRQRHSDLIKFVSGFLTSVILLSAIIIINLNS